MSVRLKAKPFNSLKSSCTSFIWISLLFLAISQLLLGQIQKVRSVLKSACSEDLKLSLLLTFGKVEAEIFEVKDTTGHFQFPHFYAWFLPVLAVRTTLLDFQKSIWHLAILLVIFSTQMTQHLTNQLKSLKVAKWRKDEWRMMNDECWF